MSIWLFSWCALRSCFQESQSSGGSRRRCFLRNFSHDLITSKMSGCNANISKGHLEAIGGFPKIGFFTTPIHGILIGGFMGFPSFSPFILGYPYFWKHPFLHAHNKKNMCNKNGAGHPFAPKKQKLCKMATDFFRISVTASHRFQHSVLAPYWPRPPQFTRGRSNNPRKGFFLRLLDAENQSVVQHTVVIKTNLFLEDDIINI